jgi:hypothetical protein
MHLVNQPADVVGDGRTTKTRLRGTPAPVPGEQTTMQATTVAGLRFDGTG